MDEKDIFNKDTMFWREVNAISAGLIAEIELNELLEVEGEHISSILCSLLPFESADMLYELEDGSAFKKNEVKAWPYIALEDFAFYKDETNPEAARKEKVRTVDHANIQSIQLKDEKGTVILTKAKI